MGERTMGQGFMRGTTETGALSVSSTGALRLEPTDPGCCERTIPVAEDEEIAGHLRWLPPFSAVTSGLHEALHFHAIRRKDFNSLAGPHTHLDASPAPGNPKP